MILLEYKNQLLGAYKEMSVAKISEKGHWLKEKEDLRATCLVL